MDLHNTGFCPKGASVVLYRDKHLRKFQSTRARMGRLHDRERNGASSKSGGRRRRLGDDDVHGRGGYLLHHARDARGHEALRRGIDAIRVCALWSSRHDAVAFPSDEFAIFSSGLMKKRGCMCRRSWLLGPTARTFISR